MTREGGGRGKGRNQTKGQKWYLGMSESRNCLQNTNNHMLVKGCGWAVGQQGTAASGSGGSRLWLANPFRAGGGGGGLQSRDRGAGEGQVWQSTW